MTNPSAQQEWRAMWRLPMIGSAGVVTCSAFTYASSAFLLPMTREFHWTRVEFTSALTMQLMVGVLVGPVIGRLIDRVGPRRVALPGIVFYTAGLSLLGLASGSIGQWRLLCLIEGATIAGIGPVVWVTAVSARFEASRGLALGVVLAGTGVGTALWPSAAVWAIDTLGWRLAFPALAFSAALVLAPLIAFWFLPPRSSAGRAAIAPRSSRPAPLPPLWPIIRSRTFLCILGAGGLYASVTLGMTLQMIPILTANGMTMRTAAAMAGVTGVATLLGRLAVGFLLDRLPTRAVGSAAFLLPVVEVLCLWFGKDSFLLCFVGVALLGLTSGAESDILTYVASRTLKREVFGSAYAVIGTWLAVAASLGPLMAAALYDAAGSYTPFFVLCIPISILSALLIALIPVAAESDANPRPSQ